MSLSPSELSAATRAILEHQRILIVPHANVDPDALSGALACFQLFRSLGKDVTVVCPESPPESLQFMPGFDRVEKELAESQNFIITVNLEEGVEVDKLRYTVEDHKVNIIVVPKHGRIRPHQISLGEGEQRYDLIIVVDTADLSLLGSLYTDHIDLFSEVPVLNIDHHISNTRYGQLQLIDTTSASVTEVLYHWFNHVPEWREKVTQDLATLLLTGLITDTRSFQNPNTTPRSLEVAAQLLDLGARQQEIIQNIYKTKPLTTLKIWGRALNRIQIDDRAGIAWSSISREDLAEMGAESKEVSGILDELISTIPDADVHVIFTEMEEGGIKASMRSSPAIDVNKLAAKVFGGGGHPRAAGFRVAGYRNFQLAVLESVQKIREGMESQKHEGDEAVRAPGEALPPRTPAAAPAPRKKETKTSPPPKQSRPSKGKKQSGGTLDVISALNAPAAPASVEEEEEESEANGND
ncbi:MAG: bifunctional oligoribonuclease/PAP phosphatase NrnA [Candidatus Peribacteraceae bacterium]|nr:bifunctional oligoribonuclease/PAP phosphatase NrnA [Candidatus Peribacteraceae bacterium]MDD5074248.1 bifunctional oligoribonuclease/PAP phosphatase NrnA [Candidatus Peribacteraceae bacterium]